MSGFFSEYISPIILAILQGVTEFLPVSSSGHLVLVNQLMEVDRGLVFDLVLHLATLVSVVLFYRKDIADIFMGCIHEMRSRGEKKNLKFVGYLLAATVLTAIIGLALNDWVESRLRQLVVVGILLIVNAGILWSSRKFGLFKLSKDGGLNFKSALIIGLVQGLAVLPGISRSGSTITAALLMGVDRKECAKISFLLSIPVILGAVVLHLKDLSQFSADNLWIMGIAAVVAAVVGYFSLVWLERLLKKASFHYFAPYCLGVGMIAVVLGILL